jgi:hypothetical protein
MDPLSGWCIGWALGSTVVLVWVSWSLIRVLNVLVGRDAELEAARAENTSLEVRATTDLDNALAARKRCNGWQARAEKAEGERSGLYERLQSAVDDRDNLRKKLEKIYAVFTTEDTHADAKAKTHTRPPGTS